MITPDYRDTTEALVHKDLRLSFDGNRYCVPPRYVGRHLTIKADASSLSIYDQQQEIVSYARCWQRGQVLGAERFQKELFEQRAAAERSAAQQRLIGLLGPASEVYLRRLADTDRSLARQVRELLALIRDYGPEAVAAAVGKAHAAGAFGADYIANILSQQAHAARGAAAAAVHRPRVERTDHRSAVAGRLRHFHPSLEKEPR